MLILLQKSANYLKTYSIGGVLGPCLARLRENPNSLDLMNDADECHWRMMQGISQLLQFKQDIFLPKDHPLHEIGRRIARQAHQLEIQHRLPSRYNSEEYLIAAMNLDEALNEFHDNIESAI